MGFFETYGKAAVYKHCLYMCRGLKGLARPWIHELRHIIESICLNNILVLNMDRNGNKRFIIRFFALSTVACLK